MLRSLSLVADLKKERFELWLTERKDDVRTLCRDQSIVAAIGRLSQLTSPEGQTENRSDELSSGLRKQTTYQNALHELSLVLNTYPVSAKISVADAKSGLILVSTEETDRGKNVSDNKFFVTTLNGGYEESVQVEKDQVNDKPYLVISRVLSTIPTESSGETFQQRLSPCTSGYAKNFSDPCSIQAEAWARRETSFSSTRMGSF